MQAEKQSDTIALAEYDQELDNPDYWQQYSWRTGD